MCDIFYATHYISHTNVHETVHSCSPLDAEWHAYVFKCIDCRFVLVQHYLNYCKVTRALAHHQRYAHKQMSSYDCSF